MNKYQLLPAYLAGALPFAWGSSDCCTFAADWLVTLGKPDPLADLRGTYATPIEARALMRSDLVELVAARIGEPMENHHFAQRGDVAVVELENGRQAVGVVTDVGVAGPGKDGLVVVPAAAIVAAWRT